MQFAQRRVGLALAGIDAPARQRELSRVALDGLGAAGKQAGGLAVGAGDDGDHDGGATQFFGAEDVGDEIVEAGGDGCPQRGAEQQAAVQALIARLRRGRAGL